MPTPGRCRTRRGPARRRRARSPGRARPPCPRRERAGCRHNRATAPPPPRGPAALRARSSPSLAGRARRGFRGSPSRKQDNQLAVLPSSRQAFRPGPTAYRALGIRTTTLPSGRSCSRKP
ncbi:MAG: hypothetical protein F9K16_10475 [Thermoanaerobaculia bacterium]|nr:MAG: hypothetical protein F9K16_10475 [Thermoanaerobaculia bacterium]